ncbi:hypothetical protein KCU85_g7547, partial [Aureobasidium melanogenum]
MQASRTLDTRIDIAIPSPLHPQAPPEEFLDLLKHIEAEISSLYSTAEARSPDESPPPLSPRAYLKVYTRVHEYDIATRAQDTGVPDKHLHHWLDSQIRGYCMEMRERIFQDHRNSMEGTQTSFSRNLLAAYMSCYRKFCRLATFVGNLLRSWERHGLRREQGDKTYVSSVEGMHQIVWKEEVLGVDTHEALPEDGLRDLKDAIAVLMETDAETREHDSDLVENVIESLSVLGFTVKSRVSQRSWS